MATGQPPQDPFEIAKRLSESFREVKFGGGVVGKTAYTTLGVIGLWAIVLFRLSETSPWWFNGGLLAAGVVGTWFGWWWVTRTQKFARENPALALLEGTQLLEYQRFEAEAKGMLPRPGPVAVTSPRQLPNHE